MSKFVLIAAVSGFFGCGVAYAAEPQKQPPQWHELNEDAQPTCNIPGHPHAVCFWQDPTAQECFVGPIISDKSPAYPARHYFAGGTLCWPGDERFFSVIGKAPRA